jgi:hypothetical protein
LNLLDERHADPEFRFQYPHIVEEHKGVVVHTFLVNDLAQMTSELTTPADVLQYLATRERCIGSNKFFIGNELDFLAFFKTRYPEIEKALSDPTYHVSIMPGIWEGYRETAKARIQERDSRFRNSGVIDGLIRVLSTSVDYSASEYGITTQESALNYLRIIGKLGKLTRIERAEIGDKIKVKTEKTKAKKRGYFIYVSQLADTAYLFLLINEDDREQRQRALQHLCIQACHTVPCSELVGVATDGAQQQSSSTDVMLMNVSDIKANTERDPRSHFQQPEHGTSNEWVP